MGHEALGYCFNDELGADVTAIKMLLQETHVVAQRLNPEYLQNLNVGLNADLRQGAL